MSHFFTRRNIISGLVISIVFVSFFVWYSYINMRKATIETNHVNASLKSLRVLEDVMDDMQDIETGQRGYVISGKKDFLEHYHDAITKVGKDTLAVKALFPLYPDRKEALENLLQLIRQKTEWSVEAVNTMNNFGHDSAALRIKMGLGRKVMDSIRAILSRIEAEDRVLLNDSNAGRREAAITTAKLFILLGLVFITGLILWFLRISRGYKIREAYEKKIAYLAGLTEKTSDAFFSMDLDGVIVSWNKGAEKIYGYSQEEAIGKFAPEITGSGNTKEDFKAVTKMIPGEGSLDIEAINYNRKGDTIDSLSSVTALKDERSKVTGYVVVLRDISERKKAARLLEKFNEELSSRVEEQTEFLKNIMERVSDGFCSFDQNWVCTYINKTGAEILGFSQQDFIGKSLWEHFPDATNYAVYNTYIAAFEKQQNQKIEFFYPAMDKWFLQHVYPSPSGVSVFFSDITEIRNAENELRASNERFEMISRTTNDAVWEWNLETGKLWGSEMHQQLYGLTLADPVPKEKEWENRIHPDDRESLLKKQAEAIASSTNIFITEYRFRTEKLGYREIYDRCYIMRNAEGKAVRMMGSMMDVTESNKIATALQRSEEKYRSMIEQASDGIFILDENGNYIDVNTAGLTMIGYYRNDINSISAFDILPDGEKLITELKKEELNAGKSIIIERKFKRKDGQFRDAEISYKRLSDGNFLAIARDITEKKKTEEEVVKTNARFQMVSKATSDIVWDLDIINSDLWWNDNYYSILGFKKVLEIVGLEEWYSRIHPEDKERVKDSLAKAIAGDVSSWRAEYSYAKADHSYLRFLDRGFIIRDKDGKATRMIGSMVDMTPVYNAQKELSESENRLRTILETDPECIKLLDTDCSVVDMNRAGLQMIELEHLEQIKGKPVLPFVLEEQREAIAGIVAAAFKGKAGRLEFEMITSKGNHRWCEINVVPFKNSEGKIIHALGVTRDNTTRKEAEIEVLKTKETRDLIMNSALDGIICVDREEKIITWNMQAEEIFGWKEADVMGKTLSVVVIPERYRARHSAGFEIYRQTGRSSILNKLVQVTGLHAKGHEIFIELVVRVIKSGEGEFLCTFVRDISERKKAEEALKYNEEKYRTVIEQAIDAIALYDEAGRVLDVNSGSVNLLGYSKEELVGMSLKQILTPEELEDNPVRYDKLQRGDSTVKYRRMRRKDGIVVETEVRSQQLPDGRFLSVIRDLTERIRAERDLAASYEAIRELTSHIQDIREEERTSIAREIHDELGQQLTVLKMDVSWLKQKMTGADDSVREKLKDLITMLDQTVQSVRRISSELRPSVLDDLGLVAAMEWQLSEFEKRSGITTRIIHPGDEILLSGAIKTALFRVFQESLTNVARHSLAKKVTVMIGVKEDLLSLSIIDNGNGFEKQKIAEKRTLGILGMKERITMIGGIYEIKGELGKGTEVLVHVPLNQSKATEV